MKKKILFFPGKDTPIKRYTCYFPTLDLVTEMGNEPVTHILCHSLGLHHAIEYCLEHDHRPVIIAMDGTPVDSIPEGFFVILFRPEHKKGRGDEDMYTKVVYYKVPEALSHYPYQKASVRDRILKYLK